MSVCLVDFLEFNEHLLVPNAMDGYRELRREFRHRGQVVDLRNFEHFIQLGRVWQGHWIEANDSETRAGPVGVGTEHAFSFSGLDLGRGRFMRVVHDVNPRDARSGPRFQA